MRISYLARPRRFLRQRDQAISVARIANFEIVRFVNQNVIKLAHIIASNAPIRRESVACVASKSSIPKITTNHRLDGLFSHITDLAVGQILHPVLTAERQREERRERL